MVCICHMSGRNHDVLSGSYLTHFHINTRLHCILPHKSRPFRDAPVIEPNASSAQFRIERIANSLDIIIEIPSLFAVATEDLDMQRIMVFIAECPPASTCCDIRLPPNGQFELGCLLRRIDLRVMPWLSGDIDTAGSDESAWSTLGDRLAQHAKLEFIARRHGCNWWRRLAVNGNELRPLGAWQRPENVGVISRFIQ